MAGMGITARPAELRRAAGVGHLWARKAGQRGAGGPAGAAAAAQRHAPPRRSQLALGRPALPVGAQCSVLAVATGHADGGVWRAPQGAPSSLQGPAAALSTAAAPAC